MSAALDWDPGLDSGSQSFEHSIADLAVGGVRFAPEQLELFERAPRITASWLPEYCSYAMAVRPMWDPVVPHAAGMGSVAYAYDPEEEEHELVLVPTPVLIDSSLTATIDEHSPHWRRFPSIIGRAMSYSDATGQWEMEAPDAFRLWDVWPLNGAGDYELLAHSLQMWVEEYWLPWSMTAQVHAGNACQLELCPFVGTPESTHRHEYDEQGYHVACRDVEEWMEVYFGGQLTIDPDGWIAHVPFPPVGGLHHLGPIWDRLAGTSRASVDTAISLYPHWMRDDIARTERHYSPWLWSF